MAKWAAANFLDNGLNYLKNNATKQLLIKAYSAGDSYATVTGNAIATADCVPGDFTLSTSGSNRVVTTATKSIASTANSGASPDLHFAFTNGSNEVIWVTDETSNQVVTAPNVVNFPALSYTSNQPT